MIGGGPIGLKTLIVLRRFGVDAVLVDKHATTAQLPKALLLNQRRIQVFRQLSLEENVARAPLPREKVGFIFEAETLTSPVFERVPMLRDSDRSAVSSYLCSQDELEPVLRAYAERLAPGGVWFGSQAVGITQDEEGVELRLANAESRTERSLRARYVVAADGAHGTVRDILSIMMQGEPALGHAVHVLFDAPLGQHLAGRTSAIHYVKGNLTFVIVDGDRRWRPAQTTSPS